jgi:hypothetical protein
MACCCALVISANLVRTGFRTTLQTGIGQQVGDPVLVTVQAQDRTTRAEHAAEGLKYFDEVERVVRTLPGVSETAWTARPPGSRPALISARAEPSNLALHDVLLDVAVFDARARSILLAGRMFGGADTQRRCKVVLINDVAANEVFAGDAVGQSMEDPAGDRVEIIGVLHTAEDSAAGTRPVVYYYGEQRLPPRNRVGPAWFRVADSPRRRAEIDANVVTADYFRAMRLPLAAGETATAPRSGDDCRIGVVDQLAAQELFDGDPVDGAIIDEAGRRTTIVAVVGPTRLRHWQRPPYPALSPARLRV